MAVTNTRVEEVFITDGTQTIFSTDIYATSAEDIKVILRAGHDTQLEYGSQYLVSGVPGTATVAILLTVLPNRQLVVYREMALTQPTELSNASGFFPKVIELALDRIVLIAQQLNALFKRNVAIPEGEAAMTLPPSAARAGKLLGFNSDGVAEAVSKSAYGDEIARTSRMYDVSTTDGYTWTIASGSDAFAESSPSTNYGLLLHVPITNAPDRGIGIWLLTHSGLDVVDRRFIPLGMTLDNTSIVLEIHPTNHLETINYYVRKTPHGANGCYTTVAFELSDQSGIDAEDTHIRVLWAI